MTSWDFCKRTPRLTRSGLTRPTPKNPRWGLGFVMGGNAILSPRRARVLRNVALDQKFRSTVTRRAGVVGGRLGRNRCCRHGGSGRNRPWPVSSSVDVLTPSSLGPGLMARRAVRPAGTTRSVRCIRHVVSAISSSQGIGSSSWKRFPNMSLTQPTIVSLAGLPVRGLRSRR